MKFQPTSYHHRRTASTSTPTPTRGADNNTFAADNPLIDALSPFFHAVTSTEKRVGGPSNPGKGDGSSSSSSSSITSGALGVEREELRSEVERMRV